MPIIRRKWTAGEADGWSREDTIAVIVSPVIYVMLMVGCALSALRITAGYIVLIAGIALLLLLVFVIDPKLAAVSREFEKKQKDYLEELDRKIRWED